MIVRGISCDGCFVVAEDDDGVITHIRTDDSRARAKRAGWTVKRGRDYCPECKTSN